MPKEEKEPRARLCTCVELSSPASSHPAPSLSCPVHNEFEFRRRVLAFIDRVHPETKVYPPAPSVDHRPLGGQGMQPVFKEKPPAEEQ